MNKNFMNQVANNESNNTTGGFTMNTVITFEEFTGAVVEMMKEYYGEGYSVDIHEVTKNNGVRYTALLIKDEDVNVCPSIYLEPFYARCASCASNSESIKLICDEIISTYDAHKVPSCFNINWIKDYSIARDSLCVKLISLERNKDFLNNVPHIVVEDMAAVFYIHLGSDEEAEATITVTNELMDIWRVDVDDIYSEALINTERLLGTSIRDLNNVVAEMMGIDLDTPEGAMYYDMMGFNDMDPMMYVVTNNRGRLGASVILYHNLLKKLAEKLEDDLIIIPSSIHETLILPASVDVSIAYIQNMIGEVNRNEVTEEEVLSGNAYYYNRAVDDFKIAR